eukprot:GHVQ01015543.1.p1 GENE.GHVQ01015543.1~~GHVQ01015543.1.p1  ORF type:complete len:758 (-),score=69.17 GHVQ01015543.1:88-2361(-)
MWKNLCHTSMPQRLTRADVVVSSFINLCTSPKSLSPPWPSSSYRLFCNSREGSIRSVPVYFIESVPQAQTAVQCMLKLTGLVKCPSLSSHLQLRSSVVSELSVTCATIGRLPVTDPVFHFQEQLTRQWEASSFTESPRNDFHYPTSVIRTKETLAYVDVLVDDQFEQTTTQGENQSESRNRLRNFGQVAQRCISLFVGKSHSTLVSRTAKPQYICMGHATCVLLVHLHPAPSINLLEEFRPLLTERVHRPRRSSTDLAGSLMSSSTPSEGRLVIVTHGDYELVSCLLHQYNIDLRHSDRVKHTRVFDTEIAHMMRLDYEGMLPKNVSLHQLLTFYYHDMYYPLYLALLRNCSVSAKNNVPSKRSRDGTKALYSEVRELVVDSTRDSGRSGKTVEGGKVPEGIPDSSLLDAFQCLHLLPLALDSSLRVGSADIETILNNTATRTLAYCSINTDLKPKLLSSALLSSPELSIPASARTPNVPVYDIPKGTIVEALMVSKNMECAYFSLNLATHIVGITERDADLLKFRDVEPGQFVTCEVTANCSTGGDSGDNSDRDSEGSSSSCDYPLYGNHESSVSSRHTHSKRYFRATLSVDSNDVLSSSKRFSNGVSAVCDPPSEYVYLKRYRGDNMVYYFPQKRMVELPALSPEMAYKQDRVVSDTSGIFGTHENPLETMPRYDRIVFGQRMTGNASQRSNKTLLPSLPSVEQPSKGSGNFGPIREGPAPYIGQKMYKTGKRGQFKIRKKLPRKRYDDDGKNYC